LPRSARLPRDVTMVHEARVGCRTPGFWLGEQQFPGRGLAREADKQTCEGRSSSAKSQSPVRMKRAERGNCMKLTPTARHYLSSQLDSSILAWFLASAPNRAKSSTRWYTRQPDKIVGDTKFTD
jgi:hypothetical protein